MEIECQENLKSIASIVKKLSAKQYQFSSSYLFGASICQHIRHILKGEPLSMMTERGNSHWKKNLEKLFWLLKKLFTGWHRKKLQEKVP